ncbi:MAG: DUF4340 domain-containing protein [Pseudomonadota bacterium]
MSSRRLMAWAMILVVAGGAWLLSNHLDQRDQEEQAKASRLWELDDLTSVQALEFKGRDYPEPLRVERAGQGQQWRVSKPLACPADSLAVGRVLNSLAAAQVSQRLDDPGPWSDFGLAPPLLELVLTDRQGGSRTLLVGSISPSQESVYLARPGQPEVLLAPVELRASLAKRLLDLRDKVVLDFPLAQVRRVELQEGTSHLILERNQAGGPAGWTLAGQGPADPEEVDNLLLQAHGLLAQGFVDQDFKPAKLGLEPPRGRLALTLADGGQQGLIWGQEVPGKNQTYVRRTEGGPLMLVQDESLKRLERQPRDLLDRRLFTLERSAVDQLKIARQGRERLFARQEGQWRQVQPPGGDPAIGEKAGLFIWDLLDLRWEKALPADDYGLDSPDCTLALAAGQDAGQVLAVGRPDPVSGLLPVRLAGQKVVYGIKSDFMDKIPQEPGAPAPAPGDTSQSSRK